MGSCELLQALVSGVDQLKAIVNSTFVSAFLSALAGAGFGVWGAQRLANRAARKSDLLESFSQAESMLVLASVVANEVLSIKKQHIAPTCQEYIDERERFISAKARVIGGDGSALPLEIKANFISIPPPSIPVEALRNKAYSARNIPGRAIALVAAIDQYFLLLSHALIGRAEQIHSIKTQNLTPKNLADVYFGLESCNGRTDTTYQDTMHAIKLYTDDVAFFSVELVEDLSAYTASLCEKLQASSGDVPRRTIADFSSARELGLLPPRESYASWLSGFPKAGGK